MSIFLCLTCFFFVFFFFSSRRRHTRCSRDWSSDVCSSDLPPQPLLEAPPMPDSIQDRLVAVERLTKLFKVERMVHLGVTSVALVMLLARAAGLPSTRHAGLHELSGLFGASGLITQSASPPPATW